MQVLQSGAWPKDPKGSYAELNLLNQPGEETWPIVHMPFILIHENLMPLGAKGEMCGSAPAHICAASVELCCLQPAASNAEYCAACIMNHDEQYFGSAPRACRKHN
eukprot:1156056-Pelagomonas_calceolata.AAC.3